MRPSETLDVPTFLPVLTKREEQESKEERPTAPARNMGTSGNEGSPEAVIAFMVAALTGSVIPVIAMKQPGGARGFRQPTRAGVPVRDVCLPAPPRARGGVGGKSGPWKPETSQELPEPQPVQENGVLPRFCGSAGVSKGRH